MHGRDESGTAAIEFILVASCFFTLVLGCVQVGLWYYARSVVVGAANEGARSASSAAGDSAAGQRAVERTLDGALGRLAHDSRVTVDTKEDQVSVTVSATLVSVVPFLDSVPVSATATAHDEKLAASGEQ